MSAAPLRFHDAHFHERTKVEGEILLIEAHLQDLRAVRNSFLPISTLPHEILCQIFQMAKTTRHGISSTTIHRLTWVSRRWRETALGLSSLWVNVDPSLGTTWFHAYLERSKGADLFVTFWDGDFSGMTTQLLSQFHRVSNLTARNSRVGQIDDSILMTPAPALQYLKTERVTIPQTLFSGAAPLLKRIDISFPVGLRFSALPSSITELRLSSLKPRLSVSDCLENIQLLPRLQNLWLDSALRKSPDNVDQDSHHPDQYRMPRLRLIVLEGVSLETSVDFFAHIYVHRELKTQVTFSQESPLGTQADIPTYLRLISLVGAFLPPRKARLFISNGGLKVSSDSPDNTTAGFVTVERGISWPWLVEIFQKFPLEYLHSLTLYTLRDLTVPINIWVDTPSQLPKLESLEVLGKAAKSFVEHLASFKPATLNCANGDSGIELLPFQALRRLILRDIWKIDLPPPGVVISFCEVLKLRKDLGIGLDELMLVDVASGSRFLRDQFTLCAGTVRVEKSKD
ncbi:hypothetical protein BDN72DRAFT_845874 [Pluteus cervinus]|uniref:Uncharacterized protein n=1 Tax=Pluteus cervinus TaxID=181527 RepID=A0ACD3AIA9_9AGAR|nr:hypothetical protein BDN72DRAFT_845874 [Pluteus cervinus]